jgi:hypothetical protein
VKHFADDGYWDLLDTLPERIQKLAKKNFELLKADPSHPSLRFKKLHGNLWSARVGRNFRVLATKESYGFLWYWIGPHDEYERKIEEE